MQFGLIPKWGDFLDGLGFLVAPTLHFSLLQLLNTSHNTTWEVYKTGCVKTPLNMIFREFRLCTWIYRVRAKLFNDISTIRHRPFLRKIQAVTAADHHGRGTHNGKHWNPIDKNSFFPPFFPLDTHKTKTNDQVRSRAAAAAPRRVLAEAEQSSFTLIKDGNPLKRMFDETGEELRKSNKKRRKETWNPLLQSSQWTSTWGRYECADINVTYGYWSVCRWQDTHLCVIYINSL